MVKEINKDKVFKKFKKVVDKRDIKLMDKELYHYLHQYAGFIAHYDIHGFRATYEDRGFLEFICHFEDCFFLCFGDHGPFNAELKQYVAQHAGQIRAEFAHQEEQKELQLIQQLASKHGLSIAHRSTIQSPAPVHTLLAPAELLNKVGTNGQFEFEF